MRLLLFSAACLLTAGAGWATSMPEAQPANGWLIALIASVSMFSRALANVEVDRG